MTEAELAALTPQERERLEWQAMLTSVLEGEVFRQEKVRIVDTLDKVEQDKDVLQDIWVGIRAWLRGRTEKEEHDQLAERRTRVLTAVFQEIMSFRVTDTPDPETGAAPPSAIDQVNAILDRFDIACSLYPSIKAMREDKPDIVTSDAQAIIDALTGWAKLHGALQQQLDSLRRWTGSSSLDIMQPIKQSDVGLVGDLAEQGEVTTFVDRILKEETLQRTFGKGTLIKVHALVETAKNVVLSKTPLFRRLNLPVFHSELVLLISFPMQLVTASLQMRLQSAARVKDPNLMLLETMTDDFHLSIALACTLKREYHAQMEPDRNNFWDLPECIPANYDAVLLESVLLYFKLLHWRLKSGTKAIYFKETDVLEAQEDIMDEVSDTIAGGSSVVAEQICGLTNRLVSRVTSYYHYQIRLPSAGTGVKSRLKPNSWGEEYPDVLLDREESVSWLAKVLDSVRLRYRKIQRYGRSLQQRFSNSAEYSLENVNFETFIARLVATDHFLVYTRRYEEDGVYIVASSGLSERSFVIRDMILKSYNLDRREREPSQTTHSYIDSEDDDQDPSYILVLAPNESFVWQGLVMVLEDMPVVELSMYAQRVRLIADGAMLRLGAAKKLFCNLMTTVEARRPSPSSPLTPEAVEIDPSLQIPGQLIPSVDLECVYEHQAHLPNVNRELQKISKGTTKLAETIMGSVEEVKKGIQQSQQYQELMENWFTFASDHGLHVEKHIDSASEPKYSLILNRLAIAWVAFICDECDPTDRKTFKWAVTALEFAMARTEGANILHLPADDFALLRQKVASCMTLLISHFDILGARSSTEAARLEEEKQRKNPTRMMGRNVRATSPVTETSLENESLRLKWEDSLRRLQAIDERRVEAEFERHVIGRVVDEEKLEDKSLLWLASSTSNISVRWQQGRFIGAGAFGSVYLAVNLDSGGLMAAKEIRFQDVNSMKTLFRQIKDELSVMEILQHPNIVEYYGIEVHREKVFIFEEYCQGGSIASLLEHGRIEDETVLQVYTMQMLDGLAYLHSKGVVHRDVKPENILLDHMGVVKFVDFGAAKIIAKGQAKTMARATRSRNPTSQGADAQHNSLTGTPMYMSPESIKPDRRGRQGAMDIWSLGCVVLECATGRKPWSNVGDNEWAIMFQIGQGNRIPPLPEAWQLSPTGISFIKGCFTLDPMTRPNAEELLNHSWMQSLRSELADVEAEAAAEGLYPPESPHDHSSLPLTAQPELAHVAQMLEERQMEDILSSPPEEIDAELGA
ncbi:kinase [Clavulina sp. PMI_390]|nr:kinase [Clavulina sp. PMI_390]